MDLKKYQRIEELKKMIATQEGWVKIYSNAKLNNYNTDHPKTIKLRVGGKMAKIPFNPRKLSEDELIKRERLYAGLEEEALDYLYDLRSELWDLMHGKLESREIDDRHYEFCEACQQRPCMCSDPEKTSTTWNM